MNRKPFVPTEERDYSPHFFVLCALLVIASAWALWNEIETRRPWKAYQRSFREIELSQVSEQLEKAEENLLLKIAEEIGLQIEDSANMPGLESAIREELDNLVEEDEYQSYLERLKRVDSDMAALDQNIRLARGEAGELFYRWKHNLHEGGDYENYRRAWYENQSRLADLEGERNSLDSESSTLRNNFSASAEKISKYQKALQELETFESNREERLTNVSLRQPEIRQIVLNAFNENRFGQPEDRVDRCVSCHVTVDKKGFEDTPEPFRTHTDIDYWFSNHPSEKMGCTPCHGGQGAALQSAFHAHGYRVVEDGGEEQVINAREYLEHWTEPMFEGDHIQTSCPLCHQTFEISGADVLNRAKLLYTELGCHACHFTKDFEEKTKIGPDLTRILSKVYPEWLVRWLKNPKEYLPKTRMPNYQFDEKQIVSISAYLSKNSESFDIPPAPEGKGSTDRGRELVESRGCLGCHSMEDKKAGGYLAPMGFDLVPDLTGIARKVDRDWLVSWLENPRGFRPNSKMPDLKIARDEANDIAAYLLSSGKPKTDDELREALDDDSPAEEGFKLIYDYGCYSCHDIKGFEDASRIAPPLSKFGNKDPNVDLYFGDASVNPDFRLMYGSEVETWDNWTFNKLKSPRIFEDEVSRSKMPGFALSDENAHALLVLLRSFNGKLAPEEYRRVLSDHEKKIEEGKNLVRTLNCIGCHLIDGKGGDIRRFYDDIALAPPDLSGEGDKVQAGWLFEFLKKPAVLRPWLGVRMPDFGLTDEQASMVTEYFNSLSRRKIPFSFFDSEAVSEASRSEGRRLFGSKGSAGYVSSLKCGSCHPRGKVLPEGNSIDWGPDLVLAAERLKPEWVSEWLKNPQSIQVGTRMPNFFYDFDEFEGEIDITELLPEPEEKIAALRDYLLSAED